MAKGRRTIEALKVLYGDAEDLFFETHDFAQPCLTGTMQMIWLDDGLVLHINRMQPLETTTLEVQSSPKPDALSLMNFARGGGQVKFCDGPAQALDATTGVAHSLACARGRFTLDPKAEVWSFGAVIHHERLGDLVNKPLEDRLLSLFEKEDSNLPLPVSPHLASLSRMAFETSLTGSLYKTFLEGLAVAYLAEAGRHLEEAGSTSEGRQVSGDLGGALEAFRAQLVETPLTPPVSIDFAHQAGVSARVFNDAFRARFGRTIFETLRKVRLDKARDALAETDLTLAEIAQASGYRHTNNFVNAFRNEYSCPPGAYRKSLVRSRTRN